MRINLRTAGLGVAVIFLSACAYLDPSARPTLVRAMAAGSETIVLLPKPGGDIGGVAVQGDHGATLLLNKPYAGAAITTDGKVSALTAKAPEVRDQFGNAIDALPPRPTRHLLYFLEGSDALTQESEQEITAIFASIALYPDPEILVIGHADLVGSQQLNDKLSLKRALHVKTYLTRHGVAAERIQLSARGKRDPLVQTAHNVWEPKNRRVEISVR